MIGKHIHNYQITARLGEGGMGIVYKATDTVLGREVALKMLHAQLIQQSQFLERFRKEARVLAQLLHPNIAVIYNFIEHEGQHFMVMEYVEGDNLDELMRRYQALHYEIVAAAFIQALEGLHHAHKKGIYHRDIKPANLILSPDGTVKLMDFGIAKIAGEQKLTQVNRVVGTIEFMAPELIEGKDPSKASDIYAAGVTMYELLTGKLPFQGNTDFNLMQDILKKKPLAVDKLNAVVPKALNQIVMQALEKKPEQRFADAKAFQQALITAFPGLKDVDLNKLYAAAPQPPATRIIQAALPTGEALAPTRVVTAPGNVMNKVYASAQRLKQNVLTGIPRPVLIGIIAVLVLFSGVMIRYFMYDPNPLPPKQPEVHREDPKKKLDSLLALRHKNEKTGGGFVKPVIQDIHVTPIQLEIKEPVTNDKKKKEPPHETGKNKKPVENQVDDKKEVVVIPDKKDEPPQPEPRKRRSFIIRNRLIVDLYLKDAINATTAQPGQVLHFTTRSTVMYEGAIVIEMGASARGQIKSINNRKMSIILDHVTAANGEPLYFQDAVLSGRTTEMLSTRNYSATLRKGINITL